MDRNNQIIQGGRPVTAVDAARANEYFEQFVNAATLKHILGYYRGIIENLHLKPNVFTQFYPKLRASLTSWRAKAVWKKFDARASHKCYHKGKAAANTRVLVIGGGPCGMRAAIEAQLLGAKVVVVEKRDRFSRNNVLHLWPFVIEDLRMLGAKKFFGKFCAGSIDHISIRQLQCILLKVALLLGVEVHTEVSFEKLIEPSATEKTGWRAEIKPANHPVSHYEFDVIIGADGKRNTLHGFSRKEFRGKLAIAITANFINKKTEAEARVEEISGVAFIFNQKFFKELQEETRIDLENIVYYKDDTHYFVMTAKKASLLEKGVIKQDLADTEKLLAPENVDREALQQYAIEAANFSTNYQMPDLEFAVNHYGQPDIAMFDFTSMYAAENASKVLERNGHRLLMILVGDSLLEPFWPTGSGCARGFLSSLDAAWAIRSWSLGTLTPLDVLAERESIYRLLAQTTPDNLNKDWKSYTLDPTTRYPNLNKTVVTPHQVVYLYDTDNASNIDKMKRSSIERQVDVPRKRRRGNVDNDVLISWLKDQLKEESDINITDIVSVFKQGKALCAIIHHYRPDLLDYNAVKDDDPVKNNQLAIDVLEKELGIPPVMTGQEITNTEDYLTMATYLTEVYNSFKGEIPHVKHPKLELPESTKMSDLSFKTIKTSNVLPPASVQPSRPSSRHKRHIEMPPSKPCSIDRKTRKRRTMEKVGASVEERQKCLEEIASNRSDRQSKRRQQRKLQTEQFLKSMQMLQANAKPDSQPFEDYAIFVYRQTAPKFEDRVKDLEKQFTYVPDHDNKALPSTGRAIGTDEDVAARIKSLEDKWKGPEHVEKKPKDLLRAIGKIETSDWNIKEIEKKIMENKMGKPSKAINKEKVPKWSKEQFAARQTKMEKKHLDRQESAEAKYADIDRTIKDLDQKLKEGTIRQLGTNKVATLTEKLVSQIPPESKPPEKPVSRPPVVLPIQGGSESCHFCGKRVYLMERLSAEGRFFHHGCFKCQYCHTQLRLGSYAFDRDGMYGFKFFCLHHFGMVGELEQPAAKVVRKPSQRLANEQRKSPEKKAISGISGVDLLDRVRTPERVEFANLSTGHISSDQDESLSQMDEDEWTDKNFGASCAEVADSDDDSSSLSDTDSDDEYAYDDALEEPATKEGTMKWAERLMNSYSRKKRDSDSNGYSSSDQSSYYDSSDDDESETATEGEEEIRARELRKQEVRVEPPVVQTDTGTDTEVKSSFQINPVLSTIQSNHHYLNPHSKTFNNSSDNISVNSTEYNSAESGDLDLNMNKIKDIDENDVILGKLTIPPSLPHGKTKDSSDESTNQESGASSSSPKSKKNVIKRKTDNVASEFISKFPQPESQPLLIIRRTPSKISLPKEVGKPKTMVNTSGLDTAKYFGTKTNNTKRPSTLKRSGTVSSEKPRPLVKQTSLPETADEIKEVTSFNFEPEDSDLNGIDKYIEDLIANEEELYKPIDPNKFKINDTPLSSEDEKCSSSIEDLLKALETETGAVDEAAVEVKDEEKIDDLLTWIEGLEHDNKDKKLSRSFSDAKYKNLEKALKLPVKSDSLVSRIPKENISLFESHLLGKETLVQDESDDDDADVRIGSFSLKRSKTEVACNRNEKPRTSVDLEAVKKVDIKKMLQKFESKDEDEPPKEKARTPIKLLQKRNSFAAFRSSSFEKDPIKKIVPVIPKPNPIKNTIKMFEGESNNNNNDVDKGKPPKFRSVSASPEKSIRKVQSLKLPYRPPIKKIEKPEKTLSEKAFKDLEKFVQQTLSTIGSKYEPDNLNKVTSKPENTNWCANITVRSIPNEEFQTENKVTYVQTETIPTDSTQTKKETLTNDKQSISPQDIKTKEPVTNILNDSVVKETRDKNHEKQVNEFIESKKDLSVKHDTELVNKSEKQLQLSNRKSSSPKREYFVEDSDLSKASDVRKGEAVSTDETLKTNLSNDGESDQRNSKLNNEKAVFLNNMLKTEESSLVSTDEQFKTDLSKDGDDNRSNSKLNNGKAAFLNNMLSTEESSIDGLISTAIVETTPSGNDRLEDVQIENHQKLDDKICTKETEALQDQDIKNDNSSNISDSLQPNEPPLSENPEAINYFVKSNKSTDDISVIEDNISRVQQSVRLENAPAETVAAENVQHNGNHLKIDSTKIPSTERESVSHTNEEITSNKNSFDISPKLTPDEQPLPDILEARNMYVKADIKNLAAEEIDDSSSNAEDSDSDSGNEASDANIEDIEITHTPHDFSKAIDSTDTSIVDDLPTNSQQILNLVSLEDENDNNFSDLNKIQEEIVKLSVNASLDNHADPPDSDSEQETTSPTPIDVKILNTELDETQQDVAANSESGISKEELAKLSGDSPKISKREQSNSDSGEETSGSSVTENKDVKEEPLYAKIEKRQPLAPPVPQRLKRNKITKEESPPPRPVRQKSSEKYIKLEPSEMPPIPPQRRTTPKNSPLVSKKTLINPSSDNGSSVKKEVVKTSFLPKPQTVSSRSISPESGSSSLPKSRDRSRSRESDVDCCIQ